jgi:hypothetical protein
MEYKNYLTYVDNSKSHLPDILQTIPETLKEFLQKELDHQPLGDVINLIFYSIFNLQERVDDLESEFGWNCDHDESSED